MTNEIIKEEYFSTLEFFKQLEPSQQKTFNLKLNEVKELKNKALNTVSAVSKNYLFKQRHKKIQETKKEILETLHENQVEKYKVEIERLKTIFKNRDFNRREKDYLIEKSRSINNFDFIHFKTFINENSKLLTSSILSDVESLLSLK